MKQTNPYTEWVERLVEDETAAPVLVQFLRNRGVPQPRTLQLAEDALQEGLVRILGAPRERWDGYAHFRNAVLRAARNTLVDQYRRWGRERSWAGEVAAQLAAPPQEPQAVAWLLHRCLERLPPDQRRLVEEEYFNGVTLRELAEQLPPDGRSESGRISAIFRQRRAILERLREALRACGVEAEP
jgi:RNA polymerase sigma factor (sigma-70 family)